MEKIMVYAAMFLLMGICFFGIGTGGDTGKMLWELKMSFAFSGIIMVVFMLVDFIGKNNKKLF